MLQRFPLLLAALFGVFALVAEPMRPTLAAERCFADWSEAGPIVRDKGLTPVSEALTALKGRGKVVKVTLCQRAQSFHYKVALSAQGGQVSWVTVDAKTGRVRPLASP